MFNRLMVWLYQNPNRARVLLFVGLVSMPVFARANQLMDDLSPIFQLLRDVWGVATLVSVIGCAIGATIEFYRANQEGGTATNNKKAWAYIWGAAGILSVYIIIPAIVKWFSGQGLIDGGIENELTGR